MRNNTSVEGEPPKRKRGGAIRAKGRTKADKRAGEGRGTPAGKRVKHVQRDLEIWDARLRGVSAAELATEHKVTVRRVEQITDEMRAERIGAMQLDHPVAGLKHVQQMLLEAEQSMSIAARAIQGALADGNWTAMIAGLRMQAQSRREVAELKAVLGVIPQELEQLRIVWDGLQMGERVLEVLGRHEVPEEIQQELIDSLNLGTVRDEQGRLALDTGEVVEGEVVS